MDYTLNKSIRKRQLSNEFAKKPSALTVFCRIFLAEQQFGVFLKLNMTILVLFNLKKEFIIYRSATPGDTGSRISGKLMWKIANGYFFTVKHDKKNHVLGFQKIGRWLMTGT